MQHSPFRRAKRAAALAGILTLGLATTPAFADDLQATDEGGDVLTNQGSTKNGLAFGDVCAGSTEILDVTLAVIRKDEGGSNNEYGNSTTVELSSSHTVTEPDTLADDATLSPGAASDIALPNDWLSKADGTPSGTSTSTVNFTAGTDLGSFVAELRFNADGPNAHNGNNLRKFSKFDVTANVVHCIEMRGAPAIANEYLRDRGDNSDCKDNLGTNKNKSNWHGQLISAVAHEFEGTTFTEEDVHEFVEDACQHGLP